MSVWWTPSSSSDAKSIAYDTDIVETLVVSGSVIFIAALADERSSSAMKRPGSPTWRYGRRLHRIATAAPMTAVT